jgi:hypothetical protein
MSRAGTAVVADTEIATFFLITRQGLLAWSWSAQS